MTGRDARDRDAVGRARNARPMDSLGRPLPRSPVQDMQDVQDTQDVPRIPDDLVISPADAAELGGRLLAEGRPFHAHEVFEAAWKSVPGPERELWRGLAQIAVGLTHARRGNSRGAMALLRRGAGHVAACTGPPGAVDADFVTAQASDLALRIERYGLAGVPEADLLLRLSRS